MGTQVEEPWRLNQVYHTFYENLADAIHYAYQHCHITAAERRRLVLINQLGNDAKHKGLGFGDCAGCAAFCNPVLGFFVS